MTDCGAYTGEEPAQATLDAYLTAGAYTELPGPFGTYEEICKATLPLDGPLIIAVDGPTNGGKTGFADGLRQFYASRGRHVSLVGLDHFLTDRTTRNGIFDQIARGDMDIADYSQVAWHFDRYHEAMERVRGVLHGEEPEQPLIIRDAYDRTTGTSSLIHMVPVFAGGIVITEGVGLHAYQADMADVHVRVDVHSDEQLLDRVLARELQKPTASRLDTAYLTWRYNLVDRQHTAHLRAASLAVAEVVVDTTDFADMVVYKR